VTDPWRRAGDRNRGFAVAALFGGVLAVGFVLMFGGPDWLVLVSIVATLAWAWLLLLGGPDRSGPSD
jgi:uncharacterized membrane protein YjjP (DUF1212 family)